MARRRRLEAPGAEELAEIEAGFAAKPTPDRTGLGAPIAQIAGEIARAAEPLDVEKRVSMARDSVDAEAWRRATEEGRVITDLTLDQVVQDFVLRDRMVVDAAEIEELKTSIQMHGLRLPIEVMPLQDGRYGLVSGWRRMTVLLQLHAEDPAQWATVKAIIRQPYEAADLYTAMVEENELRSQITPYERGRIAVMAARQGAFSDTDAAIDTIFAAASKAKRSKIRSFALIHEDLGEALQFPTDLSERNGLRLAYALRQGCGARLRQTLQGGPRDGAMQEWATLEPIVAGAETADRAPDQKRGGRPRTRPVQQGSTPQALARDVSLERVEDADGYAIRLRGTGLDAPLVDRMIDQLRQWLKA